MACLYYVLIMPIEIIIDIVFTLIHRYVGSPGLAIIGVSLVISFLTLPLYLRADAIQGEERKKQEKMAIGVEHIRRSFSGDERFMMLSTYYRENNYHPIYGLRGALPLLLQIPFFIAAYHYLTHLGVLTSNSFLFIHNLGKPDGLITVGTLTINVLPIFMTIVNISSGIIYTKQLSFKTKFQVYILAIVFLVVLYNSPSGLVLYWTMNNLFSLSKNIVCKFFRHPQVFLAFIPAIVGTGLVAYTFYTWRISESQRIIMRVVSAILVVLSVVLFILFSKKIDSQKKEVEICSKSFDFFVLGCVLLTALLGSLIPSAVIAASPDEFINVGGHGNPLWFLLSTCCISVGFCLWFGIFYYMEGSKAQILSSKILWICSLIALVDYIFFGKNLGLISSSLKFDLKPRYSSEEVAVNLFVVIVIVVAAVALWENSKLVKKIYVVLLVAIIALSLNNIRECISASAKIGYMDIGPEESGSAVSGNNYIEPIFHLSKKGKNVIVLMLDRAISGYIPFIFNEKPELKKEFSGFTYYPNTISFGEGTKFGAPALFGGYEYSIKGINHRKDVSLKDKHNEALKVMPVIFDSNGYEVTVCDVPYGNYKETPDLSIYKDCPNIHTYVAEGKYMQYSDSYKPDAENLRERNFFCYSIFKVIPVAVQSIIYDQGNYLSSVQSGNFEFLKFYSVLDNLRSLTRVDENDVDTFLMMNNNTTHTPQILQLPDYIPYGVIDNSKLEDYSRFTLNGITVDMSDEYKLSHYHVNMATMILLGKWFEYMREKEVYDNTRIIIVADHGISLGQFEYMKMRELDIEGINPLLMFKDFGSAGFTTSDEFMTNADVPVMAFKNIINNPVNPFTGNWINDEDKKKNEQMVIQPHVSSMTDFNTYTNTHNTFDMPSTRYFFVKDNIFDKSNWSF